MATFQYGLLDEREEMELHKTRLLNVEEKPFKRLTKRLVAPGAFTNPNKKLPTPPPENTNSNAETQDTVTPDIATLKADITLDFAAFDSAIARLQFLADANAAERERYAADRLRILGTVESVREGNSQLRTQLDEAKATLGRRRKFDELADKITSNRMLRTRAEQEVNLAKLAEECDELHHESETYAATWRERRAQFERLVDEGKRLRALIRDEKEEVERREGMDSDAEDGETAATPGKMMGLVSGNATPGPEGGGSSSVNSSSNKGERGSATPRPGSSSGGGGRDEGITPRPDSPGSLKPLPADTTSGNFSRATSQQLKDAEGETVATTVESEDVNMDEPSTTLRVDMPRVEETPQITVDAPEAGPEDKMDTT